MHRPPRSPAAKLDSHSRVLVVALQGRPAASLLGRRLARRLAASSVVAFPCGCLDTGQ